ncbi:Chlorophyllase-1 [Sesamum angolense]|uniref:Chlorophyllase-1 n=1 Tax=Sesamum angolense TaxID=2727404 RepID=A0AAE2C373_9LAMI|nr:Chlorophyllase-1 [Sesamum angolense]
MAILENKNASAFEPGNVEVKTSKLKKTDASSPPAELLIIAPEAEGNYPVLLFCHGYCTKNSWYSQLLQHVSSHGYIVVAPQFYQCLLISLNDEIKIAAKVANWLPAGLAVSLPQNVKPDLSRLALMGHSRGGKVAFALALGYAPTSLNFKALLGLDPVCRLSQPGWVEPDILSYVPHSFHLSIPIGIIGTGLSNQTKGIIPPLAPDGFNHSEFFNESKPPCCYFLTKDYGHCDMLNDPNVALASLVCKSGKDSKEKMRRGVGGIMVAFLKAYLGGECEDLESIVATPTIAPIILNPVIHIKE